VVEEDASLCVREAFVGRTKRSLVIYHSAFSRWSFLPASGNEVSLDGLERTSHTLPRFGTDFIALTWTK